MNETSLGGRLGQDPRLSYLPSGGPVVEFSLATDESYKTRDGQKVARAEWHRIKVFGKTAEFCANYLSKGQKVFVRGHLRTRAWEDEHGTKRFTTEIVVSGPRDFIEPIEWRHQDQESQPAGGSAPAAPDEEPCMDDVPF